MENIRSKYENLSVSKLEKKILQGIPAEELEIAKEILKEKKPNSKSLRETSKPTREMAHDEVPRTTETGNAASIQDEIEKSATPAQVISHPEETVKQLRYPALKAIAGLYKFLAILSTIAAVIGFIIRMSQLDKYAGAGTGIILIPLIYGAIAAITFLAISEGIKVIVDIEENTRSSTEYLKKVLDK